MFFQTKGRQEKATKIKQKKYFISIFWSFGGTVFSGAHFACDNCDEWPLDSDPDDANNAVARLGYFMLIWII